MNVSAKEEELFEGEVYLQEPQLNYIINYYTIKTLHAS